MSSSATSTSGSPSGRASTPSWRSRLSTGSIRIGASRSRPGSSALPARARAAPRPPRLQAPRRDAPRRAPPLALPARLRVLRYGMARMDGRGNRRFGSDEKPVRPSDPAVRRANLRRVAGLFKRYRRRLTIVLVLIGISSLLGIASPFLLRRVLDDAIPHKDVKLLS